MEAEVKVMVNGKEVSVPKAIADQILAAQITFESVVEELENGWKERMCIGATGTAIKYKESTQTFFRAGSVEPLKKIAAIQKLILVAEYLVEGWSADWSDGTNKYMLGIMDAEVKVTTTGTKNVAPVYFKTMKQAKTAIEILGDEVIKTALS